VNGEAEGFGFGLAMGLLAGEAWRPGMGDTETAFGTESKTGAR
jgi:hypothetical protein